MGHNRRIGVHVPNLLDTVLRELNMDITGPPPKVHLPACLLHHPRTEVLVRHKENISISWRILYHFDRVTASTNDIGQGLNAGATIDIGNDVVILVRVRSEE